jgi:hypothetical protein
MESDLVVDVGFGERRAGKFAELCALFILLLQEALAGSIVLRRHVKLLDEGQRLVVDGRMVPHHIVGERAHIGVLGFRQSSSDADIKPLFWMMSEGAKYEIGQARWRRCARRAKLRVSKAYIFVILDQPFGLVVAHV